MSYPTTLDSLTDVTGNEFTNLPAPSGHAGVENAQNHGVTSIQSYLGVQNSSVTSTITYGLTSTGSINPGHRHTMDNIIGGAPVGVGIGIVVNQPNHGLLVDRIIKSNGGGTFGYAQADNASDAEVVGIITSVPNASAFTYSQNVMGLTGSIIPTGIPGQALFLHPVSAGYMQTTSPTGTGQVVKPVGVFVDTVKIDFSSEYRAQTLLTPASVQTQTAFSFENTNIVLPASKGQFFPTVSNNTSRYAFQYVKFGNYFFAFIDNTWYQYGIDATTSAPTVTNSLGIDPGLGLSVSSDGQTLYSINISSLTVTLKSYNASLVLQTTSTHTFGSGSITSVVSISSSGCVAFFVLGTKMIACLQNQASGNRFWTEFTIVGASLNSPTVTNLEFYNGTVLQTHASQYATVDSNNNVYIQLGVNSGTDPSPIASLDRMTYSSPNFTSVGSSNMPITDWSDTTSSGGGTSNGGFTVPTLTTIGWYRNCSINNHATNFDLGTVYNEYSQ